MALVELAIENLPPATTLYSSDVFAIDQLGGDGYTKRVSYSLLNSTIGNTYVVRAGDTMTGRLFLSTTTPVSAVEAAPKAYVDTFVSKAGATMTGALILNTSTPTGSQQATSKAYVQNNFLPLSGVGTGAQGTGMTGYLTLCALPISAFHAATKGYVDLSVAAVNPASSYLPLTGGTVAGTLSAQTYLGPQVAKAWISFDGTTSPVTIIDSHNISSVTKLAAGQYQLNFTTTLPNTGYAVIGSCASAGGGASSGSLICGLLTPGLYSVSSAWKTQSYCVVWTGNPGAANVDSLNTNIVIYSK